MSSNFQIAYRFLTAKKRAMLMSLSCIVLGVGLFVVTQATTQGFQDKFISALIGSDGSILIQDQIQETIRSIEAGGGGSGSSFQLRVAGRKYIEGIPQPRLLMQALSRFDNVVAAAEVLHGNATVTSSFKDGTAQIYGVELDDFLRVSNLGSEIVQGDLDKMRARPDAIVVGYLLADRLQVSAGDSLVLHVPSTGEVRRYTVGAIFETGVEDVDKARIYMRLSEVRSLLQKTTEASYIQVLTRDKDRAPADAQQMEETLHHSATSWQYREIIWLSVFRALRVSSGITVCIFILIAGLAMFNTLAMMVLEKTKEIAILRSMGYERGDISRIFLWLAVIVLGVGTTLGWLFGAAATYGLSLVPLPIRGLFASAHFIVSWSIWHYVDAAIIAIVMVMVASLVPARRAARLEPGDVIRGTAQ